MCGSVSTLLKVVVLKERLSADRWTVLFHLRVKINAGQK